ncbi:MAG: hypothetical protein R3F34_06085 [Planctomycetota bacterium]
MKITTLILGARDRSSLHENRRLGTRTARLEAARRRLRRRAPRVPTPRASAAFDAPTAKEPEPVRARRRSLGRSWAARVGTGRSGGSRPRSPGLWI